MWEFIANHEKLGLAFNGWMTRQSHQHNSALVDAYDFSPFRRVVDVGGGQGSTLAAALLVGVVQLVAEANPMFGLSHSYPRGPS